MRHFVVLCIRMLPVDSWLCNDWPVLLLGDSVIVQGLILRCVQSALDMFVWEGERRREKESICKRVQLYLYDVQNHFYFFYVKLQHIYEYLQCFWWQLQWLVQWLYCCSKSMNGSLQSRHILLMQTEQERRLWEGCERETERGREREQLTNKAFKGSWLQLIN